jgi:excisionase family DNA binding protein
MKTDSTELAEDFLAGGGAISQFLGVSKRKFYYWCRETDLPVFRIGSQICARKSRLMGWIETQENNAA